MLSVVGDSEGAGDDSKDDDEDEGGEEETEDVDGSLTEAVGGEEEENKEAADEEFIDKEHESQFCLETNFMDKGEQENSESTADSKGKNGAKNFFSK